MRARVVAWLLDHIPQRVAAAPERVLINTSCILIGVAAFAGLVAGGGPLPASLLTLWPEWIAYEWSGAMVIGGCCALVGYLRGLRSVERLGYFLIAVAAVVYGVGLLVVLGWRGVPSSLIWLGIACSKGIRLLVTGAARAVVLRRGEEAKDTDL